MTTPLRKPITPQFRPRSSGGLVALLAALGAACAGSSLRAADASWNSDANGNWATNTNPPWSTGLAPGGTVGTTDIATLGAALTAARTIAVDTGRTIGGITFDDTNNSTFGYILSGGSLSLTSGGTIQTTGSTGAHTDTISTGITIAGDASTYTFGANSTLNTRLLSIGGTVDGASTTTATILNLNGANTGLNTISGIIGGATSATKNLSINKSGAGTWVLSGANTYTGTTTVSGGTLQLSSNGANADRLGAAPVSVAAGAGNIVLSNGGKISLLPTTSNAFTINANRGMTLNSGGGILELANAAASDAVYLGVISGAGSLTLSNTTASRLFTVANADSTYSGGTTIANGSRIGLVAGVSSTGPGGAVTKGPLGTGTITWNTASFRTGSGSLTTTIGNALVLQGNMTRFAGGTGARDVVFSGPVTITGGSRSITNSETTASSSLIFSGTIGDGGNEYGLTIDSSSANSVQFSGNNTFTGGVTINSGILLLGSAGALNSTAGSQNAVTFGAASTGRLSLNGNSVTISNLASNATAGTPIVQNASGTAATLTVGNSVNLSGTFAGVIQNGTGAGALSLTKAGNGTLTLSGSNSYTGATTVSAGTLLVSGSLNGTSSVAVGTGATLASGPGGGISTAASGNVSVSGFLAPGGSTAGAGAGTLTLSLGAGGKLDFGMGSTLSFGLGTASDLIAFNAAGDWLSGDGNAVLSLDTTLSGFSYANTYTIFQNVTTTGYDFASVTGYDTTNYLANVAQVGNDYVLSFAAVPEPGVAALFFGGVGIVIFFRRRHASASV